MNDANAIQKYIHKQLQFFLFWEVYFLYNKSKISGHPPTAFYIILSGTCLINVRTVDEGGEKVITINEIKEGEVFGEVNNL